VVSYLLYISKIIWPSELTVYYPVRLQFPIWEVTLSSVSIIIISAFAIIYLRNKSFIFVGWFWFLIALLPAIGLVRRGLWPAIADRFVYLPMIGILVILVWGVGNLFDKYSVSIRTSSLFVVIVLLVYAFLCHRQVSYWHDSGTLFQQAVASTKDNDIAMANLGWFRFSEKKYKEAFVLFEQMARIHPLKPDYEYAHGVLEFGKQNYVASGEWFLKALDRNEKHLASMFYLGLGYERSGFMERAAYAYIRLSDTSGIDMMQYRNKGAYRLRTIVQPALTSKILQHANMAEMSSSYEANKNYADSLYSACFWQLAKYEYQKISEYQKDSNFINLFQIADCERRLGNSEQAVKLLKLLLASHKNQCEAVKLLGRIYMESGRWDDARQIYETVLNNEKECSFAEYGRAFCCFATGNWKVALAGFRKVHSDNEQLQLRTAYYIRRLQTF
jgi:tetratricopeptide (TPR) repeat protein